MAGVVTEIEFRKIAFQVLFSAVLIDTLHAAFEDREEAFNGVGADVATGILAFTVIYTLMAGILFAGFAVQHRLVGHKIGIARNVGEQDFTDCLAVRLVHME